MINKIRSEENPVLLVDCGGFFPRRFINDSGKIVVERGLKVANMMGYAAMNIGTGEFGFGVDFLGKKSSDLTFPLVASNLSYAEGVSPFTKKFVMAEAGDLKVAILGVMFPGTSDNMIASKISGIVDIIPPGEALKSILPGIRKEADIVILLSQLGTIETKRLVDGLKGIDLVIYGGKDNKPAGCGEKIEATSSTGESGAVELMANAKGSFLGYVRLSVDDAGRVAVGPSKMISLDESVEMDEKVLEITGIDIYKTAGEEQRKAAEEQKRIAEKQRQEQLRQIKELQKLTPEEYMQKLLKERQGAVKQ